MSSSSIVSPNITTSGCLLFLNFSRPYIVIPRVERVKANIAMPAQLLELHVASDAAYFNTKSATPEPPSGTSCYACKAFDRPTAAPPTGVPRARACLLEWNRCCARLRAWRTSERATARPSGRARRQSRRCCRRSCFCRGLTFYRRCRRLVVTAFGRAERLVATAATAELRNGEPCRK